MNNKMSVEKANYDIFIECEGKVQITLDREYKGKIKIPIKGKETVLRIPIQLSKDDIETFKKMGIQVDEHCGLIISF